MEDLLLKIYLISGIIGMVFAILGITYWLKIPPFIAILFLAVEFILVEVAFIFEGRRRNDR